MNRKWLYGRNVVLTGCSSGIGREVTRILVKQYACNVMGVARNKQKLDELKQELGDRFSYRRFDISDAAEWKSFADGLQKLNFRVDILINNAGMIQPFAQLTDLTDEQIFKVIDTNFRSVLFGCRTMVPLLKKSPFGALVNVSSASAILPVGGEAIYSATKCAVEGLSVSLAQELAGFGVSVSSITPGPVKTDIYKVREYEGGYAEGQNKADSLVQSIGLTAEKAAKRIIGVLKRRKMHGVIDVIAHLMSLGVRVMPTWTPRITGRAVKACCGKVTSFRPIYEEQIRDKEIIAAKIATRKDGIYSSAEAVGDNGAFANEDEVWFK